MELHRPLGDHQARYGPLASAPCLPSADFSYSNYGYVPSPYTYSLHHATQLLNSSHGISSGIQFLHHIPQEENRSRKRRRIGGRGSPMSQSRSISSRGDLDSTSSFHLYDRHEEAQNLASRQCVDHTMSPSHYYNLTIAKGVASLSQMLCPCCGFDWGRSGGHRHVPEPGPAAMYDSKTPYMAEKPPLMQPPMSTRGPPLLVDVGAHAGSISYTESPSTTNYTSPVFPTSAVSMVTERSNSDRQDSIKYESSPVGLSRSTSYSMQESPSPRSPIDSDRQSLREPKILNASTPPSLQSLNGSAPYEMASSQIAIARYEPVEPPSTDVWNSGPMPEQPQQPCYELLFPDKRGGKRGPFKTLDLREQTAQTRRIGSCIRCRMQRIRCENNVEDPSGCCLTCLRVTKAKAGRFPCLRYKISDIRMYKPGPVPGYEWTRRWTNNISDPIQRWASSEIKTVRLSEGYSRQFIELRVRRFVPQEGDKLERTWDYNGSKRSVTIPPFALVDLEEGRKAYTKYIRDSMIDTFPRILGPKEGLLYKTYLEAWRFCRDKSTSMESLNLLNLTFKLWMSIRLSTTSVFIVGDETLGMANDILDETSPNHGKIPVPPVLGAQADLILIHHVQAKLRREVLDRLQKMTLKNKQETWFLTYLVTFMLLHNAAMIMAHDARYARKHGMKRRFARKDEVTEYHLGANILLAHFHYCNKGMHPFSDECRDKDLKNLAELDDDRLRFVHATRQYAKRHKQEWEELHRRGAYEDDYYFVSQLFEVGWQPRSMV